MLQPRQPTADQQLMTARILWGALTMSMLIYGFALFTTGQLTRFEELSEVPSLIQYLAVVANVIALGTYYIYKNKILPLKDMQAKFPLYIMCWALNESIVVVGFVAVFITADGNGLLYLTNLAVGLVANILTFPKN